LLAVSTIVGLIAFLALGYLTIPLMSWLRDRLEGKKMEVTKREINTLKALIVFIVAFLIALLLNSYGW